MKSAGKARNNGLYRHIRTSKEIIRNLLNDYYKNEICGQRITLYNLQYHNNFSQKNNLISWGSPTNTKAKYMELVVELGNDTLRISNTE